MKHIRAATPTRANNRRDLTDRPGEHTNRCSPAGMALTLALAVSLADAEKEPLGDLGNHVQKQILFHHKHHQ